MKNTIHQLCIFEDAGVENFYPLTLSRPIFDLRCGISTLAEKIHSALGAESALYHVRTHLRGKLNATRRLAFSDVSREQSCLFVNGRVLIDAKTADSIAALPEDTLLFANETLLAAHLASRSLNLVQADEHFSLSANELPRQTIDATLLQYPWDIVAKNTEQLSEDAKTFPLGSIHGKIHSGSHLVDEGKIFIAKTASVKPGAVLDATDGPIVIDEGAEVMAHATLLGPIYIGKNAKIKVGAKIYEGVTVGPVCKIGGEVEASIIHGYSNKQHEGFLGHAYIGEWCNLGADTNNSDLKNNYSAVDVIVNGAKVDTGLTFVGLFMGDHAKSGINTMFNTGTVVGFCSNVFGAGYLPKFIPSFSWHDAQKGSVPYKMEKAIEVATRVMARRKVEFTSVDEELFRAIFTATAKERANE